VQKPSILEQLTTFLKDSQDHFKANQWLSDDKMQVYVRKANRYLEGKRKVTLDIANVEVYHRGKGTFTRFLEAVHEMNPWDATYVECVLNPRFAAFFVKRFWLPAAGNIGLSDSFYLPKKMTNG
jgi:hypothetical protein